MALRADLDDLLTCLRYATLAQRKAVRTTDEIDKSYLRDGDVLVWHGNCVGKIGAAAASSAGCLIRCAGRSAAPVRRWAGSGRKRAAARGVPSDLQ